MSLNNDEIAVIVVAIIALLSILLPLMCFLCDRSRKRSRKPKTRSFHRYRPRVPTISQEVSCPGTAERIRRANNEENFYNTV
ncbi:unnamed protein product [Auanema sp. JU1783]|nr:unnamed protein product [Auanema sp. JU1783]